MTDIASPNLPSRDFEVTSRFYAKLGFAETWRDGGWMILRRGDLLLEFFPHPDLDPASSWFSCCFRLDDVHAFFDEMLAAGVPEKATGWPRGHRPTREAWGGTVGALIDPDGSLIRLIQVEE
ncbi:bleomycin resistance protein [Burkholderia pseudomultivorans]|uniref:Bleomycin resistance protein n=1 Tax=Burkholderia pseudomultivorans TaxID=1207504 RepID=A0ABU2E0D2_9BURK|nr:bleomycin resistance protein [Burkholderia pseudomultivorans]MDR8726794.1 Bleomycin resistance protein [Burkholderia pseudomultivorans]MDR8736101.1 Bleomycin resistance protein [Burkholderia pseudomultivorans]MDR8742077.1 Bleomycin resistance protein [Burkholderia pseudomultivorans]MDR8753124.1 Bleomycin resistance protein [Burkholderia pseudomultivorans]MDR8778671.1 Bleomycin resistance protein [Burkholderia pseudomultivorans]